MSNEVTRNEVRGNTIPSLLPNRSYCFTAYSKPVWNNDNIRYMVYQKEMCPETKREHFQGYIELFKPQKLSWLKKLCNEVHWEPRRGTREQARAYCMKEESRLEPPVESGKWIKGQGERSDLSVVADSILSGISVKEVAYEHPVEFMKFSKGIRALREMYENDHPKLRYPLKVIVLIGKAGAGKSQFVWKETNGMMNTYKLDHDNDGQPWWDGYEGQDILWIDEFYGGIKYSTFLKITDVYPLRLPIKGGHTYANWTKIYITSNKPPCEWYSYGMTDALERRLNEVRLIDQPMLEAPAVETAESFPIFPVSTSENRK